MDLGGLLPACCCCCFGLDFSECHSTGEDSSVDVIGVGRPLEPAAASIGTVAIPEGITLEVRSQFRLVKSDSSSIFN